MGKLIDITGNKYNRLTVISKSDKKRGSRILWLCKCDCGSTVLTTKADMDNGNTKSCGCLKSEVTTKRNRTHGMTGTTLHGIWRGMKMRCFNKNLAAYKDYGGRGIAICDEWVSNFNNFYEWAIVNGYKKGLTIDRIDNNSNYEPSNCRWATLLQQGKNKRNNNLISICGKTRTISEWARVTGRAASTIRKRMEHGYSGNKIIDPGRRTYA